MTPSTDTQEVGAEGRMLAAGQHLTRGAESKNCEDSEDQYETCKLILRKPRLRGFTGFAVCVTKYMKELAGLHSNIA